VHEALPRDIGEDSRSITAKKDVMACSPKGSFAQIAFGMGVVLVCGFTAAQDIKTNYMPDSEFSKYKTYKWVNIEGSEQADPIVDQQIKQAVDAQLASKGFTKSDDDKADLYVGSQVSIAQQKQWNAYGMGGGPRWGGGMGTATSTTIQIGTLGLDFYDSGAKQLI
jgi:hypothetical protein